METKKRAGFVIAPLAFILLLMFPIPGLNIQAARLAAIIALVVVLWITEAIPLAVSGLLGSSLAVVLGVSGVSEAFAPYANKIIFLFVGAFIIGRAMTRHGLDERIAASVTHWEWVRASKLRTAFSLAMVGLLMSMWISDTAATIIIVPIVMAALKSKNKNSTLSFAVLSAAYAALIGGIATPVGTPPNLIAMGFLDQMKLSSLDFFSWMVIGVPISLAMAIVLVVTRIFVFRQTKYEDEKAEDVDVVTGGKRPWSVGEISVMVIFAIVVVLWITPGILKVVAGHHAPITIWFKVHLHGSVVAMIGAAAIFFAPGSLGPYRPVLTWKEAEEIDWGTILLFGGGLSLGHMMMTTGLGKVFASWLITESGVTSLIEVTILSVITAKVFTELVSNTATANMLVPVAYSLAVALHVNPVPPVVGVAFGAGLAFLLPVSTPPNAVAYGTGAVKLSQMIKWGLIMDVAALIVIIGHLTLLIHLGFFGG